MIAFDFLMSQLLAHVMAFNGLCRPSWGDGWTNNLHTNLDALALTEAHIPSVDGCTLIV